MKFTRILSKDLRPGKDVATLVRWKKVNVEIRDDRTGAVIFQQEDVEVPEQWSEQAATILASKYFRKAGVPKKTLFSYLGSPTEVLPEWLMPQVPADGSEFGGETSARQVFHRLAGCWTHWGWQEGYFSSEDDAHIFYHEVYLLLARQIAAPNSPQWFNTGLYWAYGIRGDDEGRWYVPREGGAPVRASCAQERPQPHACFLTGTEDHLIAPHGIMDTWATEAKIFKYGSGSGVNVSSWRARGERLSGGGVASGVMSWLRIGDSAAGAIQSGGTTRRAAKMVQIDDDHPELPEFIAWKQREELKAAAMNAGSRLIKMYSEGGLPDGTADLVPSQVMDRVAHGLKPEVFGIGYEGEAISSVDGQNSNNSVRVRDAFLRSVDEDGRWELYSRTEPRRAMRALPARELWRDICRATWASADPGLIFDDTVNAWNTCAADGRIRTTNPCAEYHFLDWTACNLASVRLTAFLNDGMFDVSLFAHACRLLTVVLDISISMASFPTPEFAVGAYNYRTLGLGYSDLGGLLMRAGLPYDSDAGRAVAAVLTALMTGQSYLTSAEMAKDLGPFPRWNPNADDFRRVMRYHRRALTGALVDGYLPEGLNVAPYAAIAPEVVPPMFVVAHAVAVAMWDRVCGRDCPAFRNAQATLIAPTGTISFAMDCDTTGIEPEFSLIKTKNLAGGGTLRIVNRAVEEALRFGMGYSEESARRVVDAFSSGEATSILPPEHRAVFDCAQDLSPEAHIKMLAAVQPFLSGAASKTINLPHRADEEAISDAFRLAHRLGVKAVALYRDRSKLSQPLEAISSKSNVLEVDSLSLIPKVVPITADPHTGTEFFMEDMVPTGMSTRAGTAREYLPWRRTQGYRQKVRIGDKGQEQSLFWEVNCYADGRPGELWINISKQGTLLRSLAECLGVAVSVGLQHGVPMEKYVDEFIGVKFEPAGMVEGHEKISFAASIIDLIFRDLAITYCERGDLQASIQATSLDDPTKIVALDRAALMLTRGARPTGEACPQCGAETVITGRCHQCPNCSWNGGCSG